MYHLRIMKTGEKISRNTLIEAKIAALKHFNALPSGSPYTKALKSWFNHTLIEIKGEYTNSVFRIIKTGSKK